LFEGLAKTIIKRHKAVIAFWVIIFLIAIYPALILINNVIVYQQTEVMPLNTNSQASQQVINREFPSLLPKTSAILVIKGQNVDDVHMKEFLLRMENETWAENSSGKLYQVTDVLTIYSVYRTRILEPVITRLAPLLAQGETNATTYSALLFRFPSQFYKNYSQLDCTHLEGDFGNASTRIYQVPTLFLTAWGSSGGNLTNRTAQAYDKTFHNITPSQVPYLNRLTSEWNHTWNTTLKFGTDADRVQYATWYAAMGYYRLDQQDVMDHRELYSAMSNLNILNWTDPAKRHVGAVTYCNEEAFYRAWYLVTPGLDAYNYTLQAFYAPKLYNAWNSSFWSPGTAGLTPAQRVTYSINVTVPALIGQLNLTDQMQQILDSALLKVNIYNYNNPAFIHDFTLNTMATYARTLLNVTVPRWFLDAVYELGPNPTTAQVNGLAAHVVLNRTLSNIPIPIPGQILNTFIDSKHTTMLAVIGFNGDPADTKIQKNVVDIRSMLKGLKGERPDWTDYKIWVTGLAGIDHDLRSSAEADARLIEPFTALLVIVFIMLYYRSAVAPWVPLITVGMAYVMAQAVMFLIGTYISGIHYSIRLVVFTMVMGAGSDYCIFIISRFREERILGKKKDEAIKTAVKWAGESIATSGATVMVAFLALAVFSFPLVKVMGLCLAVSIGITLLMALTMIPSMLYLLGDRVFWPTTGKKWLKYRKEYKSRMKHETGYFFSAARVSFKYARVIVGVCLLISIPTTYMVLTSESSYDFLSSIAKVEAKKGVDAMADGFGAGNILPTYVVVQYKSPILDKKTGKFDTNKLNATDGLVGELRQLGPVFGVSSSAYNTLTGVRIDKETSWSLPELKLSVGVNNTTVMLTVVLKDQPSSSKAIHAIGDIRELCDNYKKQNPQLADAKIYIGGATASTADVGATVAHDFPISAVIVLLGVYLILLIVLGSVLIPFRLMLTILLSISWTIALSLLLFTFFLAMPVLWIMPLLLFVILMGLGMDYDIFLMTRIKEAVMEGKTDEQAVAIAVERTGSIITICGVIMAGAFGTMMISSNGLLQQFGFGLCFAILLDATIVRIYLVPAIMVLLKKWNWWAPFGLQKVRRDENGKIILKGKNVAKKPAKAVKEEE